MERYFPPLSVITALALDVGFNSLAEPLHAHISIVILITCLQVAFHQPHGWTKSSILNSRFTLAEIPDPGSLQG